jgi:hypothetical protein
MLVQAHAGAALPRPQRQVGSGSSSRSRPASHRFASEPQVTQSQTPDYDAGRNRGREGYQYARVARAKPRRLRPKWGHRRVGRRHCVTASTTINICSQPRYRWNSVHSGHLRRIKRLPAHRVPRRTGQQWAASAFHRPWVPLSYSRALTPAIAEERLRPRAPKSPGRLHSGEAASRVPTLAACGQRAHGPTAQARHLLATLTVNLSRTVL